MEKKTFLRKRLTALALILFASAIFIPWTVETNLTPAPSYFWSFMANLNWVEIRGWGFPQLIFHDDWFFFQGFWFETSGSSYRYSTDLSSSYGLYLGWLFVFVCQISTLVLRLGHLLKPAFLKKSLCIFGVITFPFVSLFLGVYQCYVQWAIHYFRQPQVSPYLGFWLTVVSVTLLLLSFKRTSECVSFKRFKTRKAVLGVFLVCVLGFFVVNELEFQTKVTKLMLIEKREKPGELPGDPKLWEGNFNRIVAVANIFRARIFHNNPNYYYCELEVPVISYGLMVVYSSMGYCAYEPALGHILD